MAYKYGDKRKTIGEKRKKKERKRKEKREKRREKRRREEEKKSRKKLERERQEIEDREVSKLHTETVPAQHNTRHKANVRRKTGRWKIDCERRRRAQDSPYFSFSQLP